MDLFSSKAGPRKFRCVYCGSEEVWNKPGTAVCSHCGASQPEPNAQVQAPGATPRSRAKPLAITALVLILAGVASWFVYEGGKRDTQGKPKTAVATPGASPAATPAAPIPPVLGSRIVRVDNPHIRTIPANVEYTFDDLMTIPENAPPAPDFDSRLLSIKMPRRFTTEKLDTVFLGELTNTSPDQVMVAPTVKLTLTRNGRKVDSADRSFADLPPGAHVPIFFHYDGETKAFDSMNFDWKPAKSYTFGAAGHPQLITTVTSQKLEDSDSLHLTEVVKYKFIRVHGTIANKGNRVAQKVGVYILLRDAKGQITGFDHTNIRQGIAAGATAEFEASAVIWGDASASVEAVALPVTPPSL
jgi:hypothetical protein